VWLHLHNNAASLSPQLTGPVLAQAGEHPDGAAADAPRARPDRAPDAPPPRSGAARAPAPRRSRGEPAAHAPRASAAGDRGTGEREPGRRAGRERPAAGPEPAARERGPPAAEREASAPRAAASAPRPRQPEADGARASVRAAAREGSRGAASRPREEPGREAAQREDAKADAAAAVHRRAPSAASLRGCAAAELPDSDQLEEHVSSSATASPASVASVGCLCHQPHCLHRTGGVPAGKCQQRRLIQEAHGRAPKRDGAGLSRTRGRASKVVRAMHALQAAAACGLPHGVLQGLPHFLAAHSSTHALSSSAERLLCHFIFLSIDRADRRAAWRSGRSF